MDTQQLQVPTESAEQLQAEIAKLERAKHELQAKLKVLEQIALEKELKHKQERALKLAIPVKFADLQPVKFNYDADAYNIIVRGYGNVSLMGGSYVRQTGGSYSRYPINQENVVKLITRYFHGTADAYERDVYVWSLALVEAVYAWIKTEEQRNGTRAFLQTLSLENVKAYPILVENPDQPEPYSNQRVLQYWSKDIPHHALLWEMGTGKTRGAVESWTLKKRMGLVTKCLVVCPVSMLRKWAIEAERWCPDKIDAMPLLGPSKTKIETLKKHDWDWVIINYESLTIEDVWREIDKWVDDETMVILDEFTKIKNPSARRSRACAKLGFKTTHKQILSGTPITQHAYDIFQPFMFLDCGETFGLNYDEFINRYFWKFGYKLQAKHRALDEISAKIFWSSTRFLKKDCIDIPDKVYDQRILEMPEYNREKYNEMLEYAITEIEKSEKVTAAIILVQLLRLSQITSGFVKDVTGREIPFDENPKIDALRDILETSNSQKVVIWARFLYDVKMIENLCKEMGIRCVKMTSEQNEAERYTNVQDFQNDKDTKVLIGTAGTGGHGIELTAATIVVYYSNSYSLEQRLQSEDRSHRAGQRNQVTYIDLLMDKTVDVSIYKILRQKKNIADIVTKDNLRSIIA